MVLQVAKMLWDSLIAKIPETIKTVSLFPEKSNKVVIEFAKALSFEFGSNETILACTKQSFESENNDDAITLSSEQYSSLVKLHNQLFPNTYLTGNEMVEGLSDTSTVFCIVDEHRNLLGYLYAEAEPEKYQILWGRAGFA